MARSLPFVSRRTINYLSGEIRAEEGMQTALADKRDRLLQRAIVARPEDFDRVWDEGMADYLRSGGQAIINERAQKYAQYYGDE